MNRDIYYRGYRLSIFREGTPLQKVHIHQQGDPGLISIVPSVDTAKKNIDEWLNAK
jgi:hypothetical protein